MSTIVTIRLARAADGPALKAHLTRLTEFSVREPDESPDWLESPEDDLARLLEGGDRIHLLLADDEIVGSVGLSRGRRYRVRSLATLGIGLEKPFKGRGWGRQLMELAEAQARADGLHKIELFVRPDNDRALSLYRGLGYEQEGRLVGNQQVDGHPVDDIVMGKVLRHLPPAVCFDAVEDKRKSDGDVASVDLRAPTPKDAAAFLAYRRDLCRETRGPMLDPRDALPTEDEARNQFSRNGGPDRLSLAAFCGDRMVAAIGAEAGPYRRLSHAATMGMGVLRPWWGSGLADRLMDALFEWAGRTGKRRIALGVFAHNPRGRAFYLRHGFVEEGTSGAHAMIDGRPADLVRMAKMVGASAA
ncbi:MAG: GNAT family N-acetyltransferase [Pseudomonadota bacterium]